MFATRGAAVMHSAEACAAKVRGQAGLPFDVIGSLKSRGVILHARRIPYGRMRATAVRCGDTWGILVNLSNCPKDSVRFQLAHEYGHIVLSDKLGGCRVEPALVEPWCNRFAASLLMPEEDVRLHAEETMGILTMRYGVSKTAMRMRLQELDLMRQHMFAERWRRKAMRA